MTFVVDLSRGFTTITGAQLVGLGATGFIAYIGCDDTSKNITKARFQEYLSEGLTGALVIENGQQDVLGGDKAGAYYGEKWLAGAESVGYDVAHRIGFCSSDFNETTATQYAETTDCMLAFAGTVPVAGYYGDGDSINHVIPAGGGIYGWQDDSASFTPGGETSIHARLQQRYADARAQGLAVDVNDVIGTPLYFMGETVQLDDTPANYSVIQKAMAQMLAGSGEPINPMYGAPNPVGFFQWLGDLRGLVTAQLATNQAQVMAAIAEIVAGPEIDYGKLVAALVAAGVFPTIAQISAEVDAQLEGRVINILTAATVGAVPSPSASEPEGATA